MAESLESYELIDALGSGKHSRSWRARRLKDGSEIVLKVLEPGYDHIRAQALSNELEVGCVLSDLAIASPIAITTFQGRPALEFEDTASESLERWKSAPTVDLRTLELMINLTRVLGQMHARGILHEGIETDHVLIDRATGAPRICGLTYARRVGGTLPTAHERYLWDRDVRFIAPEQTGRIGSHSDERSDLYSLGVVFYRLLTGRFPFTAQDRAGWIHAHLAFHPEPMNLRGPGAETLTGIVEKLLQKQPAERYQGATGLRRDLELYRDALADGKPNRTLKLGTHDVSSSLALTKALYGRAPQSKMLLEALERVQRGGKPELVLIAGPPGVGKSRLVRDFSQGLTKGNISFATGKVDQYRREIPYATVTEAFQEVLRHLFAKGEEVISQYRARLLEEVGPNAQLIVDLLPLFKVLFGDISPAPELSPHDAERRQRRTLRRLFSVFATRETPLVVFLDDLQWADSATLTLLTELVSHDDTGHLLLIGAYRDDEVTPDHPLAKALDKLEQAGTLPNTLSLHPLSKEDVEMWVGDTLGRPNTKLSQIAYEKTGGNPFFLGQLFTTLQHNRLVWFEPGDGTWHLDEEGIRSATYSDDIADIMASKLQLLAPRTQQALSRAAYLGTSFSLDTLSSVFHDTERTDLDEALDESLLWGEAPHFRFSHDRIQEAAHRLVPEGERPALHLQIGRALLANTPREVLEEESFAIASHLHRATHLLGDPGERARVAQLNLEAGKKAQRATAYDVALGYLSAAHELLDEERWTNCYQLAFELELHLAECELLTGDLGHADTRLATLRQQVRDTVDLAHVTGAQVNLFTIMDRGDRGVEVCLEYLQRVGIPWSTTPDEPLVAEEYERLKARLEGREIEALLELPGATDVEVRATMDVLTSVLPAALYTNQNLFALVVGRMVNLSLEHGNSDGSCLGYVWLNRNLVDRYGDYDSGYRFAKLACSLADRRRAFHLLPRVYQAFAYSVSPWTRHLAEGRDLLRTSFDIAQQVGDLAFATYGCSILATMQFAAGEHLDDVQTEADQADGFVRKAKFGLVVDFVTSLRMLVHMLRGRTERLGSFTGEGLNEQEFEEHLESDPRLAIAASWYWVRKQHARLLAHDTEASLAASAKASALLWTSITIFEMFDHHFYGAVAAAMRHDEVSGDEGADLLKSIRAHHEKLAECAAHCPENFGGRLALVSAELARLEEHDEEARRSYEVAISHAREHRFVHDEALSAEIAGRYYSKRKLQVVADSYLWRALSAYRRWGATAKATQLLKLRPQLADFDQSNREGAASASSELLSAVKASHAISDLTHSERLTEKLLELALEMSGAQWARLVLLEGTTPKTETTAHVEGHPTPSALPETVINYVKRTREAASLYDASIDAGRFATDPYFESAEARAVLCLPVQRQGELMGLLYLENDLTPGVFTPERTIALDVLATQAAISLENAHLLARERAARAGAELARQRAQLLGEINEILVQVDDPQAACVSFARTCVRWFADWVVIDAFDAGRSYRLGGAHRDATKDALLRGLATDWPASLEFSNVPSPPSTSVCYLQLKEADLQLACPDSSQAMLLKSLGTVSVAIVPMVVRSTRVGTFSLVSATPERFSSEDLKLASELARRVATSIENARLGSLEQKLHQAQKLEAIGRLAGGVAHDFNNLLCVILSYTNMILGDLDENEGWAADVRQIQLAGERAAGLTRRLLAFSRQQVLKTRPVDLGEIVREMAPMLRRIVGENLELSLLLSPSLAPIAADPSQMEQVLLNLVVNARDAMPDGGVITIEANSTILDEEYALRHVDVRPGKHVRLSVSDTGRGMTPETCRRIFEPFFTTKSEGEGTGLGLATVFGIVTQSAGHATVSSEVGGGTTFNIYLPVMDETALRDASASAEPEEQAEVERSQPVSETVLLVEDDEQVRLAARTILERCGYRVLQAAGPGEALLVCDQERSPIDLLLSDVIMPRMSGPELAKRVVARHPDIRTILMSGHTNYAIVNDELGDSTATFLQKPFSPAELAQTVRAVLDRRTDVFRPSRRGSV